MQLYGFVFSNFYNIEWMSLEKFRENASVWKKMSLQKVFHTTFCLLHPHLIFMQLDAAYTMYASYVELG